MNEGTIDGEVFLGYIHQNTVAYLEKLHYNLSHLWCLIAIKDKYMVDIPEAVLATLERKNLVLNGNLTNEGSLLLDILLDPAKIVDLAQVKKELKKVKSELNNQFLTWWEHYPVGNTWKDDEQHSSKLYKGTRGFRTKKDDCEKLYLKALADGYKPEELLTAIDYEVDEKKIESRRSGTNKLDYMVNTHSYLLNKLYINFIEMMKIEGIKPNQKKPESTGFQTMLV